MMPSMLRGIGIEGWLGLVLVALVLAMAAIGPFLTPASPYDFIGMPFAPPAGNMPLGADDLGRDVFSRLLDGGYCILGLSAAATLLGTSLGAILGIVAAYVKGRTDDAIMRLLDVVLAFPQIIMALLFVSILGPHLWLITAIVASLHAPQVARVARAATLSVVEEDYVLYAESLGLASWRIVCREILPNIATPLAVEFGLRFIYSIGLITGLNFLGLGIQPPTADWGLMINENRIGMPINPWPVAAPVALIMVLTVGLNLLTDAVSHRRVKK